MTCPKLLLTGQALLSNVTPAKAAEHSLTSTMTSPMRSSNLALELIDTLAAATRALTLEELVRPLLELLEAVTGLESTYLTTVDESAGVQHVLFARNTRALHIPEGLSVPWEGTLCKRALDEGKFYVSDVADCWGDCEVAKALGIETYVSSPVRTEHGELFGTLCAASDTRQRKTDGTAHVLQLFANLISQHVVREKLMAELHRANHLLAATALVDSVTQLPNRRALMDDMQRRLSNHPADAALIVAFIDLDHFKAINDQHGHDVGDRFLAALAKRLNGALRTGDLAARLGGDEFVVLASAPREIAEAASLSLERRLTAATRGRFTLTDIYLEYEGPSIGVIIAPPECRDPQTLLSQADAAMYAVKRARKEPSTSSLNAKPRRA